VTNFGTCAILALPPMPERQLRFLLALETFTRGGDGWREAGIELLAKTAGFRSSRTADKARGELVSAGMVDYRPGGGRGHRSAYRIRVRGIEDHLKAATEVAPFSPAPKGGNPGSVKGAIQPDKGGTRNAVASDDSFAALEPYALQAFALPDDVPGPADGRSRRPGVRTAAKPRTCDRNGPGPHSDACRNGNSAACAYDWCQCRCHGSRAQP
jgi:hypothetical protein